MSPIQAGYGGQSLLFLRPGESSPWLQKFSGMIPVSSLFSKSKLIKFVRLPNSEGISPPIIFDPRPRYVRFIRAPRSVDMLPLKKLSLKPK